MFIPPSTCLNLRVWYERLGDWAMSMLVPSADRPALRAARHAHRVAVRRREHVVLAEVRQAARPPKPVRVAACSLPCRRGAH